VYLLLFVSALMGGLLTYLTLLKKSYAYDDKKIIEGNNLFEQPIIFIDSSKIIERYMIYNYSPKNYSLDTECIKGEVKQKLIEFLKNHPRGKSSVVISGDGFISGAIDLTRELGDSFIFNRTDTQQ